MNKVLFSLLILLSSISIVLKAGDPVRMIDVAELKQDVAILASDSLQGRKTGTLGGLMARGYLIDRLKKIGYDVQLDPFGDSCNLYVFLPGKTDSIVIVGAHYDHLGICDGEIYNGADDNASGVAALLQLTSCFSKIGKPVRSIVFAFWDAEESGLRGSLHYALTHDLSKVCAYMNFDMIGRNHDQSKPWEVFCHYTTGDDYFRRYHDDAIKKYGMMLKPVYSVWDLCGGSDNTIFAYKGISCIWWHTDSHPDYHKPTDTSEKLNYQKMTEIVRSSAYILKELAY